MVVSSIQIDLSFLSPSPEDAMSCSVGEVNPGSGLSVLGTRAPHYTGWAEFLFRPAGGGGLHRTLTAYTNPQPPRELGGWELPQGPTAVRLPS